MDETKYVAVPVEPTLEMTRGRKLRDIFLNMTPAGWAQAYRVMITAAPTTHVAVKRELLERALNYISPSSSGHSDEVVRELRALLSQKGE